MQIPSNLFPFLSRQAHDNPKNLEPYVVSSFNALQTVVDSFEYLGFSKPKHCFFEVELPRKNGSVLTDSDIVAVWENRVALFEVKFTCLDRSNKGKAAAVYRRRARYASRKQLIRSFFFFNEKFGIEPELYYLIMQPQIWRFGHLHNPKNNKISTMVFEVAKKPRSY